MRSKSVRNGGCNAYSLRLKTRFIRTAARKAFDYTKENYIHGRGRQKATLIKSLEQ